MSISLSDEFGGAIKVPIIIQFKLKDYKYVKSFRDRHGLESKMIYSKVKEEVDVSSCFIENCILSERILNRTPALE